MSQHDLLDTLRSLALPDDCPELHGQDLPISKHAIRRYQERVESWGAGELRSDSGNLSLMLTGIPYQGHGPRS